MHFVYSILALPLDTRNGRKHYLVVSVDINGETFNLSLLLGSSMTMDSNVSRSPSYSL